MHFSQSSAKIDHSYPSPYSVETWSIGDLIEGGNRTSPIPALDLSYDDHNTCEYASAGTETPSPTDSAVPLPNKLPLDHCQLSYPKVSLDQRNQRRPPVWSPTLSQLGGQSLDGMEYLSPRLVRRRLNGLLYILVVPAAYAQTRYTRQILHGCSAGNQANCQYWSPHHESGLKYTRHPQKPRFVTFCADSNCAIGYCLVKRDCVNCLVITSARFDQPMWHMLAWY